jgi:hypothetical protein
MTMHATHPSTPFDDGGTDQNVQRGTSMNSLRRWMYIVGGFYVLMGLFNTPPIIRSRFSTQYPDIGVETASAAGQALGDVWFMFGLEVLVIGVVLLHGAREPARHLSLVWAVIGLEAVRGVAFDLYLIAQGYPNIPVYLLWILLHTIIITSGIVSIRRAHARPDTLGSVAAPASISR